LQALAESANEPMTSERSALFESNDQKRIALSRRPRISNGKDASDEHRKQQEQSRKCQHRKSAVSFKWVSQIIGKKSNERVRAEDEVCRREGAFSQEIIDE
jgi:hypothetical protein